MKTQPFGARSRDKIVRTVIVSLITVAIALTTGSSLARVRAQQPNRAGLVVDFGDHHAMYCIEFAEPEITGYEMLRRAGLDLVVTGSGGMGFAVCDINGTSGCPASNCFCRCQGSTCTYWSYHHLVNGSWQYSQMGASSYKVQNGDVEGWGWGEGVINSSGAQPPVIPFDEICAPPATDTPMPTNTPIPPTNTPIPPTDTPAPTSAPDPDAWFRLDNNPIAAGSCTMLRWDTSNAHEIYLDDQAVDIIGNRQVCPTEPTDYELRVVGLEEEKIFRLTLGVTGSVPTATHTPKPTAVLPSPTAETAGTTPPPPSPTPQAAAEASASSTATASPVAPTPTTGEIAAPSPSKTGPAPSSGTPAQIAQAQPTATHAEVAALQGSDEDRTGSETAGQAAPAAEDDSPSALIPIGYIAFSLIVGGLVGWLIYVLKFRGNRA